MNHNQSIFAAILAIVSVLALVLVYRGFFASASSHMAHMEVDLKGIEESLKKILADAPIGKSAAVSADGTIASGLGPEALAEMEKLKKDLAVSKATIEELQKKSDAGGGAKAGPDNSQELLGRIRNLEERLAEYEIIEDDIADLSLYKEENAKLKKEIETLKAGGAQPAPVAAAAPPAPKPGTEQMLDSVVGSVAPAEPAAPTASIAATEPAPIPATPSDARMEAFDTALDALDANQAKAPEAAPLAAEVVPEATATAAVAGSTAIEGGGSDIFAEFKSDENPVDPLSELGEIDADKMLEEIKDLGGMGGADVLAEGMDLEKFESEATKKS